MSQIDKLKASIEVTVNEIVPSVLHFASTQGLDLRDDTHRECMEIIDRIERKMLSNMTKKPRKKPSTTD